MAMTHSPMRTRSQTTAPVAAEGNTLEAVLLELQQLREERRQERQEQERFRSEMEARFLERENTLRHLEEHLVAPQLSPSENILNRTGADACGDRVFRPLKLKTDTYDGTAPLREFLSQFSLIARASQWTEGEKAVVLASCLRGKARSLLDSCADGNETLSYAELKAKLELRFGESELTQNYYLQFINRKQSFGEDFATLGADLERLSRKAYPECTHEVRDKIACSQFIVALSDRFVKRFLQTEGVTSLRVAIERAKTLKFVNLNSFSGRNENTSGDSRAEEKATLSECVPARRVETKRPSKTRKREGRGKL